MTQRIWAVTLTTLNKNRMTVRAATPSICNAFWCLEQPATQISAGGGSQNQLLLYLYLLLLHVFAATEALRQQLLLLYATSIMAVFATAGSVTAVSMMLWLLLTSITSSQTAWATPPGVKTANPN